MTSSQQSSYGVCRVTAGESDLDLLAEEILRRGFVVADSGLSPADVAEYRERLDAVYTAQQAEVGGEEVLQRINDANIVRCPLAYDDKFLAMATLQPLMQVAGRLLGENFVLLEPPPGGSNGFMHGAALIDTDDPQKLLNLQLKMLSNSAARSSTASGRTMMRTSRPACSA